MIVHDLPCLCFWLVLMVSLNVISPANATDHGAMDVAVMPAAWLCFNIQGDAQVLIPRHQSQ